LANRKSAGPIGSDVCVCVRLQTPKRGEGDPNAATRMVTVRGTAAAVAKAKEMIAEAIKDPPLPEVNIAGHKFVEPDALWQHCKDLIAKIEEEEALTGGTLLFVFALLSFHPGRYEKYGPGLVGIKYGVNEEWPDTKCFIAVRSDGTEVGFSYRKCIDAVFEGRARGAKRNRHQDDSGGFAESSPMKRPKTEKVRGSSCFSPCPPPPKSPATHGGAHCLKEKKID
jgi:hypothetical protein